MPDTPLRDDLLELLRRRASPRTRPDRTPCNAATTPAAAPPGRTSPT